MSIILYQHKDFKGRQVPLSDSCADLRKIGFNDKASSVEVERGRWILWKDIEFSGRYYIIGSGSYNLEPVRQMLGNDVLSSVQKLSDTA